MEHPGETRADDLWNAIAGRLRDTLTETTYDTWFGQAHPRSYNGEQLVVEVPNDFTRDWIEGHFLDLVTRAAGETATTGAVVNFTVGDRIQPRAQAPQAEPPPQSQRAPSAPPEAPQRETTEVELNPKYTFDLFVIGSSNRFAHAAALAVAEAPAQAYNPLFIYGGTGLGKTHLLQAIGNYVRQHSRRLTTRYVTSETFMNEFIDAVRDRVHVLFLVFVIIVLAPWAGLVPLAALAAILFFVAWNMADVRHVSRLMRTAPIADRFLLFITFVLTVFVDLVVAVNVGVVIAALLFMRRMAETVQVGTQEFNGASAPPEPAEDVVLPRNVLVYRIDGPLFFGAAEKLESTLERTHLGVDTVVIRLGQCHSWTRPDSTRWPRSCSASSAGKCACSCAVSTRNCARRSTQPV